MSISPYFDIADGYFNLSMVFHAAKPTINNIVADD